MNLDEHRVVASVPNADLAEAVWNIGDDRFYAFNSNLIVYRDDKQLYAKFFSTGKEHKIGSFDFTQYSRLFVTDSNTIYCIASGPLESETLLEIQVSDDGASQVKVIDQVMDTQTLKLAEVEGPDSIIFNVVDANGERIPIEGFYYAPLVS